MIQNFFSISLFILFVSGLLFGLSGCEKKKLEDHIFRLHLLTEPQQLDPAKNRSSSANYFFSSTMRGLYNYDQKEGLVPEGGECQWQTKVKLICKLFQRHKWSNGEPVTSDDYIRAFRHLIAPSTAAPRAHLLFSLKNGKKIHQGSIKVQELGVQRLSDDSFTIELIKEDSDFKMKLTSTALFPRREENPRKIRDYEKWINTGPYLIETWRYGQWLQLKPNPHYSHGHPARPRVRFYFIDSDLTALRLYEKDSLDFLRRFPSNLIDKFRHRKDFLQMPMARFDYIGFGPRLQKNRDLREALVKSLNYKNLQALLEGLGRPGCPSLPAKWLDRVPCYAPDFQRIESLEKKISQTRSPLVFGFSQLGGEDMKKQAEWFQSQWRNYLHLSIELRPMEQKSYISLLRSRPPDIFRKGVGLDIPSCLNALKTFTDEGAQNYIEYSDKRYLDIIEQMEKTHDLNVKKTLCRQAVEILMADFRLIPLGEMHFSLLAKSRFKGWRLNSLNQLDLSQLHPAKKIKP